MVKRAAVWVSGLLVGFALLTGCPAKKSSTTKPAPQPTPTPKRVGAVAPDDAVVVPTNTPAELPTRPVPVSVTPVKGQAIGPVVTHFGLAKADGHPYEPQSVEQGIAVYNGRVGSGFILVIEGKAGLNNTEVGRSIFNHDPQDPKKRPDLQLISNKPLGDGSELVCDKRKPEIGGVPAATSFRETQAISDAMNDVACRFETFVESSSSCTVTKNGDFSFVNPASTVQYCMIVARSWNFPVGTTELTVRLRDVDGNVGPPQKMRVERKPEVIRPTPTRRPARTPSPKPLPTRAE